MKSVIFSGIFIIIIIVLLVFFSGYTKETTEVLSGLCEDFYKTDSIFKNMDILNQLKEEWEKRDTVLACFLSHEATEVIDETLAELEEYIKQEDKTQALAHIARLKFYISSLSENNMLNTENLF